MASLKELKLRIASVKSTQKITKAKQMVAAAKLRKAQAAAEAARPYGQRLEKVVASLASKVTGDQRAAPARRRRQGRRRTCCSSRPATRVCAARSTRTSSSWRWSRRAS